MVVLARGLVLGVVLLSGALVWTALSRMEARGYDCESQVVLEVLNGCGVSGIGEVVGEALSDRGFDVMLVGNADDFHYAETLVIDRSGDRSKALVTADALGGCSVISQLDESCFVDATVVIGGDLAESLRGPRPAAGVSH